MQNFNTNQTRHLYVAGAIDANVDTNLDIALGTTATGEMYFKYKNADGLVTRSDSFDPKKIVSLKHAPAASLAKKLLMAVLQETLEPIRLRRAEYEKDIPAVYEILRKGCEVARAEACDTMDKVRRAMKINYFDDRALIEEQARRFQK